MTPPLSRSHNATRESPELAHTDRSHVTKSTHTHLERNKSIILPPPLVWLLLHGETMPLHSADEGRWQVQREKNGARIRFCCPPAQFRSLSCRARTRRRLPLVTAPLCCSREKQVEWARTGRHGERALKRRGERSREEIKAIKRVRAPACEPESDSGSTCCAGERERGPSEGQHGIDRAGTAAPSGRQS
jgi:hypothetical protein